MELPGARGRLPPGQEIIGGVLAIGIFGEGSGFRWNPPLGVQAYKGESIRSLTDRTVFAKIDCIEVAEEDFLLPFTSVGVFRRGNVRRFSGATEDTDI